MYWDYDARGQAARELNTDFADCLAGVTVPLQRPVLPLLQCDLDWDDGCSDSGQVSQQDVWPMGAWF